MYHNVESTLRKTYQTNGAARGHSFSTCARRGGGGQVNAYERVQGGRGLTHEVRTQSKKVSAFCMQPAIFSFAKDPSQTLN